MKTVRIFIIALAISWGMTAFGQTNVRRFAASSVTTPYLTVDSSTGLGTGRFEAAFLSSFEKRAMVLLDSDARTGELIDNRLLVDASFAYGVLQWLDIGLVLPLALGQTGTLSTGTDDIAAVALGDPRLAAKFIVFDRPDNPLGVSVITESWLPVGQEDAYAGEGGPGASVRTAFEFKSSHRLRFALNAAYHMRPKAEIVGAELDDELRLGAAAYGRLSRLDLIGEMTVATDAFAPFAQDHLTAGEFDAGARFRVADQHYVTGGAGIGLLPGIGSPTWRLLVGYSFQSARSPDNTHPPPIERVLVKSPDSSSMPRDPARAKATPVATLTPKVPLGPVKTAVVQRPARGDADGDGIPDGVDACPFLTEDMDGFRDTDGCPDLDNDLDFVPDIVDKAPLVPEDWDTYLDTDGRPDPDNDGDGIADAQDACPLELGAGNGCPGKPINWTQRLAGRLGAQIQARPIVLGGSIFPGTGIEFEENEPDLLQTSKNALDALALFIRENPTYTRVEVGIHQRTQYGVRWSLWLSQQRAKVLTMALVDRGVDPSRLFAVGYGSSNRVWPAASPESKEHEMIELRILRPFAPSPKKQRMTRPKRRAPKASVAARSNGKPVALKTAQRERIKLSGPIRFLPRRTEIARSSSSVIQSIATVLKDRRDIQLLEVAVHTDSLGNRKKKLTLSNGRAQAVVSALIEAGVSKKRLMGVGYGGSQPLKSNRSIEGRAANRRVEFVVLKKTSGEKEDTP